jgi:peptidyl-prolyl cis-trans isomerase SurA
MRISGDKADPQQLNQVAQEVKTALNSSDDIASIGKLIQPKISRLKVLIWVSRLSDIPAELAARVSPLPSGSNHRTD